MTDDIGLVKKTAEKYGFYLEFETKKILEKDGYQVDLNAPLAGGIEVDVKASGGQDRQLLIECKGTTPSSYLILIKEPGDKRYDTRRHIIPHTHFAIAQYKPYSESSFYTFTGDFFNLKNDKELKRSSINDNNNNFYKAQTQVIKALNAISIDEANANFIKILRDGKEPDNSEQIERCFLIPLIVTNAKIWVVDYTKDEVIVEPHKWALQKTRTNDQLSLQNKHKGQLHSISVAVVSINYLDQFIKCIGKMRVPEGEIAIENSCLGCNKSS